MSPPRSSTERDARRNTKTASFPRTLASSRRVFTPTAPIKSEPAARSLNHGSTQITSPKWARTARKCAAIVDQPRPTFCAIAGCGRAESRPRQKATYAAGYFSTRHHASVNAENSSASLTLRASEWWGQLTTSSERSFPLQEAKARNNTKKHQRRRRRVVVVSQIIRTLVFAEWRGKGLRVGVICRLIADTKCH